MKTILLISIMFLVGCGTTVGKLNPALTSIIPDAQLKGTTYNDGIVQNVERKGVIKRYECRTYILRKKRIPKACK